MACMRHVMWGPYRERVSWGSREPYISPRRPLTVVGSSPEFSRSFSPPPEQTADVYVRCSRTSTDQQIFFSQQFSLVVDHPESITHPETYRSSSTRDASIEYQRTSDSALDGHSP
ncbi:hypothetical protein MTP99_008565 [Tenebrio molitor]|nr:hypothetical protein MTP99_008565 [Tenebrio molitor]